MLSSSLENKILKNNSIIEKYNIFPDEDWFCPAIPPIPNGKCYCNPKKDINFCEPFYLTMKIQCSCNEGYRLVGQRTLTCTDKGLWNYDQPTCVKGMYIYENRWIRK